MYYFSTIDGTSTGKASHYYKTRTSAITKVAEQNTRAEKLGIKTRYGLGEVEEVGIESKEVRE